MNSEYEKRGTVLEVEQSVGEVSIAYRVRIPGQMGETAYIILARMMQVMPPPDSIRLEGAPGD